MKSIETLNLSDSDFDLLVEALEHLPSKDLAGDLMGGLLDAMFIKDKDKVEGKIDARIEKAKQRDIAKAGLKEDIRILQGKLILLKRWLLQQGALKQVHDILD